VKVRRLGCFLAQWSVLVCLVTGKAISFVREGGGMVDTRGRLKGRSWPWVGFLLRERRLGLGVEQVRDVIKGSGPGVVYRNWRNGVG
jgi:hypothetical protein